MPQQERIEYVAMRVRQRREALGLDQGDLKALHPRAPSRQTVGALEARHQWPMTRSKRVGWSAALGWEGDALHVLAQGDEPVEASIDKSPGMTTAVAEVIRRLRDLADEALGLLGQESG